jgi:hypothetical protein
MARYVARVRTSRNADEVFAYMADLRNFAGWDPGVARSEQVVGDGAGPDAVYDVTVRNGGREMTLRYEVVEYDPSRRVKVVGKASVFTSIDVVEVSEDGEGTLVVYDATLRMPFPLSLADPLLAKAFRGIGDKAAAGLERVLVGTLVR